MNKKISVKVHPKSRQEKVEQNGPNEFEVWTPAAPDKGAANAAVSKLLGKFLNIPPSLVRLKKGATSRVKVYEIP